MFDKGDIYKGSYEGLYCYGCEAFYLEKDLKDGKCPIHDKPVETIKEESYFFRMSKYQKRILEFLEENRDFILPETRREEMVNRVREGLKDLSVSRFNVEWGIPIPFDKNHRIYVWKEALENYISALGYPDGEKFRKFWPCDYHFIGIDINFFHSVIWPCVLMSMGVEPPKHVFVHGFINIKGEKMSKSRGIVVDPIELVDKYGVDPLRYFLTREITFGEDGDFSEETFAERVNNELVANYSNLFYRVTSFIEKNFSGKVPKPGKAGDLEKNLQKFSEKTVEECDAFMEELKLDRTIKAIMALSSEANKYFQHKEPWERIKSDKEDAGTTLYYSVNVLRTISSLLHPFIPETSERALKALNVKLEKLEKIKDFAINPGHEIKAEILFRKIGVKSETLAQEPFSKLDLKVAEIQDVLDHPQADKLYILKISLGKEKRQIVAGIKKDYPKKDLLGKKIIVLCNLKLAKIKDVESQGMLLAADNKKEIGLLFSKANSGSIVSAEGTAPKPAAVLDIEEFSKIKLISKGGKVFYKNKILKTGKDEIFADKGVEGEVR